MAELRECPLPPHLRDRTGEQYERLTVLRFAGYLRRGRVWVPAWWVRCSCKSQTEFVVDGGALSSGNTQSCKCLRYERLEASKKNRQHGLWNTPEWRSWSCMNRRCYDVKHKAYPQYGGRSPNPVTVCAFLRESAANLLAILGKQPTPQHSVDRIDGTRGYECGRGDCPDCGPNNRTPNCRWATVKEQAQNRCTTIFLTHEGETMCILDWAKRIGVSHQVLLYRLKVGWEVGRALRTPTRPYEK